VTIADDLRTLALSVDGLLQENTHLASQVADRDADIAALNTEFDALTQALEDCRTALASPAVWFGRNEGGTELEGVVPTARSAIRVFKTDANAPWTDVDGYLAEGRRVYLSVRTPAQAEAVADTYGGADNLVLIVHHEPENDSISPTLFRVEQAEAVALVAGRLPMAPVLMAATYRTNADAWIDPTLPYVEIGVDGYLRAYPWNSRGFDLIFESPVAFARSHGLPLAICEVGVLSAINTTVVPESAQAAEFVRLHSILDAAPEVRALMYFHEAVTKDATRDYRFAHRPTVLAAYRDMVKETP